MTVALVIGLGCGGDETCTDCELCTSAAQGVDGTELTFTPVLLLTAQPVSCDHVVLASAADVAAAFPAGDAPTELIEVDFAVDRVVLASSNPEIRFIVDDGTELVVGEELLCRGAAPDCVAHIVSATTRSSARVDECPYRGPDPCLAP